MSVILNSIAITFGRAQLIWTRYHPDIWERIGSQDRTLAPTFRDYYRAVPEGMVDIAGGDYPACSS